MYVEPFLLLWAEACLIMVGDIFGVSWIHFARILWLIFASMFIEEIGL